jgi:hypothetical protein
LSDLLKQSANAWKLLILKKKIFVSQRVNLCAFTLRNVPNGSGRVFFGLAACIPIAGQRGISSTEPNVRKRS